MDAVRLLGSLLGNNATGGNLLGTLLKTATGGGGQQAQSSNPLGALGGLLGGAMGGGGQPQQGGGGGLLGTLAKAAMGGALGGGGAAPAQQAPAPGAGGLLGALLGGGGAAPAPAQKAQLETPAAVDEATLLIRAMCNAAKADGQVDQQEQQNIVGRLGDVSDAERNFVVQELSAPLDLAGFAGSVPAGLAPQVYALSVMTVKVDTPQEAKYLNDLGQALKLDNQTLGAIHQQLGVA